MSQEKKHLFAIEVEVVERTYGGETVVRAALNGGGDLRPEGRPPSMSVWPPDRELAKAAAVRAIDWFFDALEAQR